MQQAHHADLELALDIGGTDIKMCFRLSGSCMLTHLDSIPSRSKGLFTPQNSNAQAMETLCVVLNEQMTRHGKSLSRVLKVVISVAGPVDFSSGHLLRAYNLGGKAHQGDLAGPLKELLTSNYKAPAFLCVHTINDALAPALGILSIFEYSDFRPKPVITFQPFTELPALCVSLGTSVGVSAIAAPHMGAEELALITLPETWVSAKLKLPNRPYIWQALGAKAVQSLDLEAMIIMLLGYGGVLSTLLGLWNHEASLTDSPRTVIFVGGCAKGLTHLDGTTWRNPERPHAPRVTLAVPTDTNELTMYGALNFRAPPMVCKLRRVAVIQGLETTSTEIIMSAY